MSKVTDSEARLVLRTMAKVQNAVLDYALGGYTDDYMMYVEFIGLRNKLDEIIERNRKDARGVSPKPLSRAVADGEADLITTEPTQAETVDDMLCVTGEVTLGAGLLRVKVFHHDAGEHIVGIKHREFGDLIVKLSNTVKVSYIDTTVCQSCGSPFTAKDINVGRCLSCGSMIT